MTSEWLSKYSTVWKFHEFSITQNLSKINFWNSRSAKSAILSHLEAWILREINLGILKVQILPFYHI